MKGTKVTFGRRLLAVLLTVLMFASGNVQVFAQVVEGTLADLANSTHTIRVTTDEIAAAIARSQSEDFATEELELEGVKTEVLDETTGVEAPAEDIEASEEEVSAPENKGGENAEGKEPAGGESATDGPKDDVSSSEGGDASSESNAPASSESGEPASSEANAPASSESGEPASSEANAPASSEAESHASSEAQAPVSSEAGSDNGGSTGGDSVPAGGSDNGGGSTGGDSAPAAGSDNGGSTGGDSAPAGGSDNGGSTGGDSAPAGSSDNGGGSTGGDSAPAASTLGAFIRNAGVMDSGSSSEDTGETENSAGASLNLKIDNRETQTYELDPEIKALFDENVLRLPLDSVTFQHEIAKMMEGKLLVKFTDEISESCQDCQAIVAIDPVTGELVAVGINASDEQHGFKLEIVDSLGNPVALSEIKAVVSVAVQKELSGKALERLLAEAANNEKKEVEVTQVVVDASASVDVNSKADAPESSTEDKEPAGGNGGGSDNGGGSANDTRSEASSTPDEPASSEANAPASSEAQAPASPEANEPASSEASAPASSEAQAPASSEAGSDNGGSTGGESAPAAGSDNGGSTGGESAPAAGSDNGGSTGGSTTPAASTLGAFIRFEADTTTVDAAELEQIVSDSTAVSATVTEITSKETDPNKVTRSARSITTFSAMSPAWQNPELPNQAEGTLRVFLVDENNQPRANIQVRLSHNSDPNAFAPSRDGVVIDETLGYVDIDYKNLKTTMVYIEYKAGSTWVKAAEMNTSGQVPTAGINPGTVPENTVTVAKYLQPAAKANWLAPEVNQFTSYTLPVEPKYYTKTPQVVLYTLSYADGDGFYVESRVSGGNVSDKDIFTYEVKLGATPYNGEALVFSLGSVENGTPVTVTNGIFTMKAGQYAKFAAPLDSSYTVTQTSAPNSYTLDRLVANGTLRSGNTYTDKVRVVDNELETNRVSFTNKQTPSVSHASATKERGASTGEPYTYDIKLTIEDTPGYNPGNIGADVVIVMDLSKSMLWENKSSTEIPHAEGQRWYDLQMAANRMITALLENSNNRVAVVGYGGDGDRQDRSDYKDDIVFDSGFESAADALLPYYYGSVDGSLDLEKIYAANGKPYVGNTNGQAGLIAARELIASVQGDGRQKYVVFMTDGSMTSSVISEGVIDGDFMNNLQRHNDRALYSARLLNSMFPDTKIYTAGFGEANTKVVNPSGVNKYHDAYFSGAKGIDDAFQQILAQIGTQSTNLKITDPMSEFVTFKGVVDDNGVLLNELPTGVKFDETTKTLTWAPGSINGKLELTYRVTVNDNDGAPPLENYGPEYGNVLEGTGYPANKKTEFTYTKSNGSAESSVLDTPRVPGRVTNGRGGQLSVTKQSDINGGLREPYTFTLTRDNGIAVAGEKYTLNGKTLTTNANGEFTLTPGQTARFGDLLLGENNVRTTYTITETSPAGNTASYTVKNAVKGNTEGTGFTSGATATGIQLGDGVEAAVVFQNASANGYASFTVSKEAAPGASIPEDVAFTFTVAFDGKTLPAEYTVSGASGVKRLLNGEMKLSVGQTATFANVPKGMSVTVSETANSDYPCVNDASQTAALGDGTAFTFVNGQYAGQTLTVEKVGSVRGAETDTQPLGGVTFELRKGEQLFQTLITASGTGIAEYSFQKGESGTFTLVETSLGSAWANEYTLTSGTLATITVSATGALSIKKGAGDVTVTDNTVTVKNPLVNASITINKTDADGGAKLAGAEFALYTSKDEGGNTGKTATSGVNGTAKFENLAYGTYYVKETTAPKGYNLPTNPWTEVTLGASNANAPLSITNAQKTVDVKLSKTAEDTGLGMVGVKFDLYKGAAKVNTYTTATGGTLTVAGLTAGSYYFVENGKVDGYLANTAKYAFIISLDETTGNLVVSGDAVTNGTVSVVNKPSYSKTNSITVYKTAERIVGVDKENFTFTLTGTPDDNTLSAGEEKSVPMFISTDGTLYTGNAAFIMANGKAFPIGSYKLVESSTSKYWTMESFVVTVTTDGAETTYGENQTFRIEANTTSVVATVKNIAKPLAGTTVVVSEKVTASAGFTPEEHTYTFTGPNTNVNGAISAPAGETTPITWGAETSITATQVGEYQLQRTDNMENKRLELENITVVMNGKTTTVDSLDKLSLLLDGDSNGKTITVTLNYKELAFSTVTVEKKLAAGTPVNVGDTFTVTFTGNAAAGRPNSNATVTLTAGEKKNVELQTGLTYTVTEAPTAGYTLTSMADTNAANTMVKGAGDAYNYTLNAATGAVTVTNTLTDTASLTLTKEITNNGNAPLNANDKFELKVWRADLDEATAQTVTLANGGSQTLSNLNAGKTYNIREVLAADSKYKLASIAGATAGSDGVWQVAPTTGEVKAVTVENAVKMGSISVLKLDAATGAELSGAEFTATRTNAGDTAFSQKIAGDGKAVAVPFGTYEVVETTAPAGYAATTEKYTVTVNDEAATVVVGDKMGDKTGVPNTFNKADGTVVTVSKTLTSGKWLVPADGETFSFEIRKGNAGGTAVGKASVKIAQGSTTANATFTAMDGSKLALDQGEYYVVETATGANFELASITGTDTATVGTGSVVGNAYVFTVNAANNKDNRTVAVSVNNADKTSGPDKSITARKVLTSGAGMNADFTITIKDPAGATHTGTTKGAADGAAVTLDTAITNFHMGTYVVSETASAGAWTTSYKLVDAANESNVKSPDTGKSNEFTLGFEDLGKSWVLVVTNTANNEGSIVLNKLIKDGENDGVIVNPNEEFVFTLKKGSTDVTLTQADVTGAAVKDGKLYVKPGQTVTIKNLTLGESYTLTEDTTGHPDYTFRSITTAEQTGNTGSSITVNMLPQVNIESISDNIHNSLVTVEKIVSGMNLYATEFTITLTPEAKFTNAKPASVTLKPAVGVGQKASDTVDLIHGVTYTVSEDVPALYQLEKLTVNSGVAGSVTVSGTEQTVTVTNKMVDASLDNTKVLANKVFDGGANGLTGTFDLTITGPKNIGGTTGAISADGTFTLDEFKTLPIGDYTVVEKMDTETAKLFENVSVSVTVWEGALSSTNTEGKFSITEKTTKVEITVTNRVKTLGDANIISVDKVIAQGAGLNETFDITLTDADGNTYKAEKTGAGTGVIALTAAQSRLGVYTISELYGASWAAPTFELVNAADAAEKLAVTNNTFTLGAKEAGKSWVLVVTNKTNNTGSIEITKAIDGTVVDANEVFTFTVKDGANTVGTYDVKAGEAKKITGLKLGETYTVSEDTAKNTNYNFKDFVVNNGTPAIAPETSVTVRGEEELVSTSTNKTTSTEVGEVTVRKLVNGTNRYPDTTFTAVFTSGDSVITQGDLIAGAAATPVAGLIYGLTYTVTETLPANSPYQNVSTLPGIVTVTEADKATVRAVTITNVMKANKNVTISATKTFENGRTNGLTEKFDITIKGEGATITGSTDGTAMQGATFTLSDYKTNGLKPGTYTVTENLDGGSQFEKAPYEGGENISITVDGTPLPAGQATFEVTDTTASVVITVQNRVRTLGTGSSLTVQKQLANGVGVASTFNLKLIRPDGESEGSVVNSLENIPAVNTPVDAITLDGTNGENLQLGTYTIDETFGEGQSGLWNAPTYTLYRGTESETFEPNVTTFTLTTADIGKQLRLVVTNKTRDNGQINLTKLLREGDVDVDGAMFEFTVYESDGTTPVDLTDRIGTLGDNVKYDAATKVLSVKAGTTAQLTGFTIGSSYVIKENDNQPNYNLDGLGLGTLASNITAGISEVPVTMGGTVQNAVSVSSNKLTNANEVTLTKLIDGTNPNANPQNFTVTFKPTTGASVEVGLPVQANAGASNPVSVTGLVYGMTYKLTEGTTEGYTFVRFGGTEGSLNGTATVTVEAGKSKAVTVTNTPASKDLSKAFAANKTIASNPGNAEEAFQITITGPDGFTATGKTEVTATGGAFTFDADTFKAMKVGTYTVKETDAKNFTNNSISVAVNNGGETPDISPNGSFEITVNTVGVTITVDNTVKTIPAGNFTVEKLVDGASLANQAFTITVTGPAGVVATGTVNGADTINAIDALPIGTYTVTETFGTQTDSWATPVYTLYRGAADTTGTLLKGNTFEITPDDEGKTLRLVVTNTTKTTGSIVITKAIDGTVVDANEVFTFTVKDGDTIVGTYDVKAGETNAFTVIGLKLGKTYTVSEDTTKNTNYTFDNFTLNKGTPVTTPEIPVKVLGAEALVSTSGNKLTTNEVTLEKIVSGENLASASFNITFTPSVGGTEGIITAARTVDAGIDATSGATPVAGLIYGVTYTVAENTLPDGYKLSTNGIQVNGSTETKTIVVTEANKGTTQAVVVTNEMKTPGIDNITATKTFVDSPAGNVANVADTFTLEITGPQSFKATATATNANTGFDFGEQLKGIKPGTYTIAELAAANGNYKPANFAGQTTNVMVTVTNAGTTTTTYGAFTITPTTTAVDITVQNKLGTFDINDAAKLAVTETVYELAGQNRYFTFRLYDENAATPSLIATKTVEINAANAKTNVTGFVGTGETPVEIDKLPYGKYKLAVDPTNADGTAADSTMAYHSSILNGTTYIPPQSGPEHTFAVEKAGETKVDFMHTAKVSSAVITVEKLLSGILNFPGTTTDVEFTLSGGGKTYDGIAKFDATTEQVTVTWKDGNNTIPSLTNLLAGDYTLTETTELADFDFGSITGNISGGTAGTKTYKFTLTGDETGTYSILSTSDVKTDGAITIQKLADKTNGTTSRESDYDYFKRTGAQFTFTITPADSSITLTEVQSTVKLAVDGTADVSGLPRGIYTVKEDIPTGANYSFVEWDGGGISEGAARKLTLADPNSISVAITATNKLNTAELPFSLTKQFEAKGLSYTANQFKFTLTSKDGATVYNGTLGEDNKVLWTLGTEIANAELYLPVGNYTLAENSENPNITLGHFTLGGQTAANTVVVTEATTDLAYTATNVAVPGMATLALSKSFAFNGEPIAAPYAEDFTFTVYDYKGNVAQKDGKDVTLTLNAGNNYTANVELSYGAYTVKETSTSANYEFGSWVGDTGDTLSFTLDTTTPEATVTAQAVNNVKSFNASNISVSELVNDLGGEANATFTFELRNAAGVAVETATVTVTNGNTEAIKPFTGTYPMGSYSVVITTPDGRYTLKNVAVDGAAATISGGSASFNVTGELTGKITVKYTHDLNTYTGKLTFVKALEGGTALSEQETFLFTLTGAGRTYEGSVKGAGDIVWKLPDNTTATVITGLPGGTYTVTEKAATNFTLSGVYASGEGAFGTANVANRTFTFTLPDNGVGSDHVITFTNAVKADGVVTVTKTASNELGGKSESDYARFQRLGTEFTFKLTAKDGKTYTAKTKVGGTATFDGLPYGNYTLEEVVPANAGYSFDSWTDGGAAQKAITVLGNTGNSYTAVNTAHFGTITIVKESSRGGKLSATFQIIDKATGKTVDTIVTDATTGLATTKLLPAGTYVVHESIVPANHTAAADVELTITANGQAIVKTIVNTYKTTGGGGGGGGPWIPGGDPPTTNIPDGDIPLAAIPEELKEIPDEQIPLANLPNTGGFAAGSLAIIGTILLGIGLRLRRKDDKEA